MFGGYWVRGKGVVDVVGYDYVIEGSGYVSDGGVGKNKRYDVRDGFGDGGGGILEMLDVGYYGG